VVTAWFAQLHLAEPWWILIFAALGAGMMGSLGLIAGLWAEKFDQLAAFQNFFIMPLTFLSGVFYSVKSLPGLWQAVSHLNPFFYMIDGFRRGFFGLGDVPPATSLAVVGAFTLVLAALTLVLIGRGWKLRPEASAPSERPSPSPHTDERQRPVRRMLPACFAGLAACTALAADAPGTRRSTPRFARPHRTGGRGGQARRPGLFRVAGLASTVPAVQQADRIAAASRRSSAPESDVSALRIERVGMARRSSTATMIFAITRPDAALTGLDADTVAWPTEADR
jgi:hypothetical protein